MIKLKRLAGNITMFVVVTIVCSVFAELTLRIILSPVDYLRPTLMSDEILRHRIKPGSGGHDSWGFRNRNVPKSVDIVAIGDSQTYGNSAAAMYSWPVQLGEFRNKSVYNMGMGGYGPVDYYYLTKEYALGLNPQSIIVGFYLGNDIKDSYRSAYSNDNWLELRDSTYNVSQKIAPTVDLDQYKNVVFLEGLREWLGHHSILYMAFIYHLAKPLRNLATESEFNHQQQRLIYINEEWLQTGINPSARFGALDFTSPKIKEGLRISLLMFQKMFTLCSDHNINFEVILIPIKSSVFDDFDFSDNSETALNDLIEVVRRERLLVNLVKSAFDTLGINYVDPLPYLKKAALTKQIYPANYDGHPNKAGYQVIAQLR